MVPTSFPNLKFYSCTYRDENLFQTYYGRIGNYLAHDIFDFVSIISKAKMSTQIVEDSVDGLHDHRSASNLAYNMVGSLGI